MAVQKRTLETRARLFAAAEEIIEAAGFEAMRVEEVVLRAGVAKGTFFAHFCDKDALMDILIGARIDALLDDLSAAPPPRDAAAAARALGPLIRFISSERYVFDIVLRYSGAAAQEEVGPIAATFGRFIEVTAGWASAFRSDIPADLLAEGVQAFLMQAIAAAFCALHNEVDAEDRLAIYLEAWLSPGAGA